MRYFILGAVIAARVAFGATPASADAVTGNKLLEWCGSVPFQQAPSTFVTGACLGYILGVGDTLEEVGGICVSPTGTANQFVDIVDKWLLDHPETRDQPARVITALALGRAFPCPKTK